MKGWEFCKNVCGKVVDLVEMNNIAEHCIPKKSPPQGIGWLKNHLFLLIFGITFRPEGVVFWGCNVQQCCSFGQDLQLCRRHFFDISSRFEVMTARIMEKNGVSQL